MFKTIAFAILGSALLLGAASAVQAQAAPDVKALIEQLKDKDEANRLRAAKILGRLKEKAKDAIPDLTTALQDPDEDVRSVAKKSLAVIKEAVDAEEREVDFSIGRVNPGGPNQNARVV